MKNAFQITTLGIGIAALVCVGNLQAGDHMSNPAAKLIPQKASFRPLSVKKENPPTKRHQGRVGSLFRNIQ